MSALLPEGIDHVVDAPHTWHEAVVAGLRWLKMYENVADREEVPPKRIWLDGDKWNAWWEEVERKRNEKHGLPDAVQDPDEDPNATYENNEVGLIAHGQ